MLLKLLIKKWWVTYNDSDFLTIRCLDAVTQRWKMKSVI